MSAELASTHSLTAKTLDVVTKSYNFKIPWPLDSLTSTSIFLLGSRSQSLSTYEQASLTVELNIISFQANECHTASGYLSLPTKFWLLQKMFLLLWILNRITVTMALYYLFKIYFLPVLSGAELESWDACFFAPLLGCWSLGRSCIKL